MLMLLPLLLLLLFSADHAMAACPEGFPEIAGEGLFTGRIRFLSPNQQCQFTGQLGLNCRNT